MGAVPPIMLKTEQILVACRSKSSTASEKPTLRIAHSSSSMWPAARSLASTALARKFRKG